MRAGNDRTINAVAEAIGRTLRLKARRPLVVGLCGAQGSGKSTLAAALRRVFERAGIPTAVLSLDDLYLTRAERAHLAASVHPLLLTRGVPGTHDIGLGLKVIGDLEQQRATALPRFDKARDDRMPQEKWEIAAADTGLLILEGWCVGARPQPEEALAEPVNALEREEDGQGIWRGFANAALAGDYQRLFARIDLLVLLAAPGFGVVHGWRSEQERDLRALSCAQASGAEASSLMTDTQLARFIQHYERLTEHMLVEMADRADMVVMLAGDRSPMRIVERSPQS